MPDSEDPRPPDPGANSAKPAPLTDLDAAALLGAARVPQSAAESGTWQPPSPEELQRSFPQYEIRGFLGRGGMGAVYQAWQTSLDRLVAIKILPPAIHEDGMNFAERFKQEAKAMAKLRHPGIVAVYDAGETKEGLLFFIMEYIEGKDLSELISEQGRLPAPQALEIFIRTCAALDYAHGHAVIHRDIKPSNIMIEADGMVKVADFGLAKFSSPQSEMHTRSDVSIGSPNYVAPETELGSAQMDHRADLYAVGVMLYQMLTGRIPRGRFDPPSMAVPGLNPRCDRIVDKAMQADREKRYATAAEMKRDAEEIRAGAEPPGGGRSSSTGRRVSWGIAATACVALTVGGFTWWNRSPLNRKPPAPRDTPAQSEIRSAVKSPLWRNALAETPLKEVIAMTSHTPQGYRLPAGNHWRVPRESVRSGALRVRASSVGSQFLSLCIFRDDGMRHRVRFREQGQLCVLTREPIDPMTAEIEARTRVSCTDGQPHELLFGRMSGRLWMIVDGDLLHEVADPSEAPGKFVLDIFGDAEVVADKVEYVNLDGVSEADARKLFGIAQR